MKNTLTQSLLDKDFSSLKSNILKVVDKKIERKIEDTKKTVLDKFNGIQSKTEE